MNMAELNRILVDYDWVEIVNQMDDDIREEIHFDFAPCSKSFFLAEYMIRHKNKFSINFNMGE